MLHHPHPLINLEVKVMDFEILRWSFWLKILELDISWTTPHLLDDPEVKVTDLEYFMINEMSISHQSVIKKHSSFKYKNLGGSASIP